MSKIKILLTGATGYIGGSVLAALVKSNNGILENTEITCVIRNPKQAESLTSVGVKVAMFNGLDETDVLAELASEHDIVIQAASGFHTLSARALILGLAQRKKTTGKDVHYIHTTGTSNVGDRPITKKYIETAYPLSDKTDIFSYMKQRDEHVPYAQRTSDIVSIELGLEYGVKTYHIMSPSIYGIDTSPLHEFCHVPVMIRAALRLGQVAVIGDGSGIWDHVHIKDVASLYELIVDRILKDQLVPYGKDGIFFVENGQHTWRQIAQRVADAGVALGAITSPELKSLSLSEGKDFYGQGWALLAEIGWASNSWTRADKARELGWKPQRTEKDWEDHFVADWEAILESNRT